MATPDKRTELDHCAATCRQCYTTCQRVVTEAHPAASTQLHMLLLSCADACRVCADMLDRAGELDAQLSMATMAQTMSQTCAHLCTTTAEACWQADHGAMREPAALLRDCAHQCRELSPDLTVPTQQR